MKSVWIVVADSAHARIFTIESPSSPLAEIEDLSHAASRLLDREITTDLPGRIKNTSGVGHAYEQPTDPKQHEAEVFAHEVVKHVETAFNANKFKKLLLIAEPSFLGALRQGLPEQIKNLVAFELAKNITKQSPEEIRRHLPDYI